MERQEGILLLVLERKMMHKTDEADVCRCCRILEGLESGLQDVPSWNEHEPVGPSLSPQPAGWRTSPWLAMLYPYDPCRRGSLAVSILHLMLQISCVRSGDREYGFLWGCFKWSPSLRRHSDVHLLLLPQRRVLF